MSDVPPRQTGPPYLIAGLLCKDVIPTDDGTSIDSLLSLVRTLDLDAPGAERLLTIYFSFSNATLADTIHAQAFCISPSGQATSLIDELVPPDSPYTTIVLPKAAPMRFHESGAHVLAFALNGTVVSRYVFTVTFSG